MDKLIFVGGAKGVGKTTVLDEIVKVVPIEIINTGKIYISAKDRGEEPEKAIFDLLISHEGIADTHYAGYQGKGFVRGLSSIYLKELKKCREIELVLVDLCAEDLIRRRKSDKRTRIEDYNHLRRELKENRQYFERYCKDLLTQGHVIFNIDLETCVSELSEIIK